jgi:7-cyano-7-deazaguanine synthase
MKTLVLLSGGLDSTVLLHKSCAEQGRENVEGIFFHYGQRHNKEFVMAQRQSVTLGIRLFECHCESLFIDFRNPMLGRGEIPKEAYKDGEVPSTFVPFRNGILLSIAAAYAYENKCNILGIAAHANDIAAAYPDCTPDFIAAMDRAVYEGTKGAVDVYAPFVYKTKADIVQLGSELGVDFRNTWSCYEGGERPCGQCATCIDRAEAFKKRGLIDHAV